MQRKLFILFLVFLSSLHANAQTAEEIINRYIDFIGSEKQWKAINTIVASGEYMYGGVSFPFTSYSKAPNLYKFVVTSNGKYYAQAYDGKAGWKIDVFNGETTPTLLKGKAALAMSNEADVELEDVLINYKAKGHQLSLEGRDTAGGKTCFKIKLTRKNGETETCYFDEKTSALIMKKAVSKNAELKGAILNIFYDDYRSVKNIKIPFKMVAKTDDQPILTVTIRKADLNTIVADTECKPPGSK